MWRWKPLLKMTLRMFFLSVAIITVSTVLAYALAPDVDPPQNELPHFVLSEVIWSIRPALILALPLPLVTVLFFREIRRPILYRFTMLTVALIADIVAWAEDYIYLKDYWVYQDLRFTVAIIVGSALAIYMSVVVAGKYLQDVAAARKAQPEV